MDNVPRTMKKIDPDHPGRAKDPIWIEISQKKRTKLAMAPRVTKRIVKRSVDLSDIIFYW